MKQIKKTALVNSLLTALYIIAVGAFMYYGSQVKIGKDNAFLAPIAMLLLFVFSASLTGFLVVGKPLQLYIDGKKKEALSLLFNTLLFLFIITVASILLLFAFTK
jgi:hypothetical protein